MAYQNILTSETLQVQGIKVPSRITSLLFWREVLKGNVEEYKWIAQIMRANKFDLDTSKYSDYLEIHSQVYHASGCGFCGGAGARENDGDLDTYYCLCWIVQQREIMRAAVEKWGSPWVGTSLSNLRTDYNSTATLINELKKAVGAVAKWIENPYRWLVLSGEPGTGKTHMLNAIMQSWYPWSMYVVATDFENRLRSYLGNTDDGPKIQDYMNALQAHPILLLDDLGIEYSSEWIAAKLDTLIEYRSREGLWRDRPVAIATNIKYADIGRRFMRDGVSRIGSRLSDVNKVRWYALNGLDFRSVR